MMNPTESPITPHSRLKRKQIETNLLRNINWRSNKLTPQPGIYSKVLKKKSSGNKDLMDGLSSAPPLEHNIKEINTTT
jgi:hypothetical protein